MKSLREFIAQRLTEAAAVGGVIHENSTLVDDIVEVVDSLYAFSEELSPLATVNRFEVIDWLEAGGRVLSIWEDFNFCVDASLQDDGRTLKIFLKEEEDE